MAVCPRWCEKNLLEETSSQYGNCMPLRLLVVMILSLKAEAKTMLCIGSERCDLQRIVFRVPFWNFNVVSGKDMGFSSN